MLSERYRNDHKASMKLTELQQLEIAKFYQKLDKGQYQFETIECPTCNSSEFEKLAENDRYGLPCDVVMCKKCGLTLTNPRLTEESYNDFYNSNYRAIYLGRTSDEDKHAYFKLQYKRATYKYNFIKDNIGDVKQLKVLEIGCAAGGILKYFEDKGATVTGIDLGEEYLEFGRKEHGLNLKRMNLFDLDTSEKYDLIIYSHVVEHILDPASHFNFIKQILNPGGKVFVEVPGLKSMHKTYGDFILYMQNAHVYHFTLKSLANMITPTGFSMVKGNDKILSLWEMSEARDFEIDPKEYSSVMSYLSSKEFLVFRSFNIYLIRFTIKLKSVIIKALAKLK